MLDTLIRAATIYDGAGNPSFVGNIGTPEGVIIEIANISSSSRQVTDADGAMVTPGFVDVHTHYDGHLIWDSALEARASHGLTTMVAGNCGVGFAPVHYDLRHELVSLMEGVEDDRTRGPKLPLELLIHRFTARPAELFGFRDRGRIAIGKPADIDVIDFEKLACPRPIMHNDLPSCGKRLLQPAKGSIATMVNGVITRSNDWATGSYRGAWCARRLRTDWHGRANRRRLQTLPHAKLRRNRNNSPNFCPQLSVWRNNDPLR